MVEAAAPSASPISMDEPLTLEMVCEAMNSGDTVNVFPPDTDWWQLAREYAKRFEGPNKYAEYDSVEVMCPGISGQFLDMVLEAHM